ncbi:hypothetical protein E2C01_058652 [Portunus trituberculatus]|uniref:Uncharacterized protein n=1 Tax=Portunus trituberculatus TaxID=210409 RepID=A0A5B7H6R3_PORTR|nr:hypothetical protein [Portunus trituberculatus]
MPRRSGSATSSPTKINFFPFSGDLNTTYPFLRRSKGVQLSSSTGASSIFSIPCPSVHSLTLTFAGFQSTGIDLDIFTFSLFLMR